MALRFFASGFAAPQIDRTAVMRNSAGKQGERKSEIINHCALALNALL